MKDEYEYKEPANSKIVEYIHIIVSTVLSIIWFALIILFLLLPVIAVILLLLMIVA